MKSIYISSLLLILTLSISSFSMGKKDITFKSGDKTLQGTLYQPKGTGPFPAIVFVHGSGPETRNNSNYSGKWFASIGYVALAYDKRGTGDSDGSKADWSRFSIDSLAEDVVAAVNYLVDLKIIDKTKIGLHAASQGGWVAPLAATKTEWISFMIIKSASVVTIGQDRIFERSSRLRKEGFNETQIAEAQSMQLAEALPLNNNEDSFTALFDKYKKMEWFPRVYGENIESPDVLLDYRKWYSTVADFDPIPFLKLIEIPVFWIFGDPNLDNNGPVEISINNVNKLKTAGKVFTIKSYPGEGHNVKEKKYEQELYSWLSTINNYTKYQFKKH